MARYGFSLSGQASPASRMSPEHSVLLPQHSESVANLANVETLKATLGLTRKESYWRLMHSRAGLDLAPEQFLSPLGRGKRNGNEGRHHASASMVTVLDISQRPTRPPSRNLWQSSLAQRQKSMPTDRDYRRMLNKLDKIINGSVLSFRCMTLSEAKPADLTLDTDEWQYLKVRTEGMQIPMRVGMNRTKGKVTVYLSKSSQEPSDLVCDEVYAKDVFIYSEPGLRFKQQWVFLGVKCIEEATLTVTVRFGLRHKKYKSASRLPSLTDLNELRKDDVKRQALNKHVDALLSVRQEAWASKYNDRDFIRENKATLGKAEEEVIAKRDLEQQRREEALKRHMEVLHEKKARAKLMMRRQELRIEAEAKARVEREEKDRLQAQQRQWLSLLPFLPSVERIWDVFTKRKADIIEAGRQVKAAMVLQRCYRKVCLTINPKRLVRQHALHHLMLFTKMAGPEMACESRERIMSLVRDSAEAHRVTDALCSFYRKSNPHAVQLIQMMWRRYRGIKQERLERLTGLWTEAIRLLLPEHSQPSNKKAVKKAKELETKYLRVDRDSLIRGHLKSCQRQFYKDISSYIKSNKAFRRGIKAFIYAKMKKGEVVYLSGAPDFHYLVPITEIQKWILEASSGEGS